MDVYLYLSFGGSFQVLQYLVKTARVSEAIETLLDYLRAIEVAFSAYHKVSRQLI